MTANNSILTTLDIAKMKKNKQTNRNDKFSLWSFKLEKKIKLS